MAKKENNKEVLDNGFDISIDINFPDIDLYLLAGMYLAESKERKVDISLIKQHIKRAISDTNGSVLVMGPLGVIPNIYRRFTIEDTLRGRNEIAKMMESVEKLKEEYENFLNFDNEEKRDDYYLKASESFKMFVTVVRAGKLQLLDAKRNADGKIDMLSADFNKKAKQIQNLLFEEYLKEIVNQYHKLLKPLADKNKIIGFVPSNEENKAKNIGAFDIMEALAEKLDMKDKYIPYTNLVKIQAKFKSYLTNFTEQHVNVYASALPTNSINSAESLIRKIAANNPSFDVFILSGCVGTAIINEERWYRDEKLGITISKPQIFIIVPSYAEIKEPNAARPSKNLLISQTNNYKIKLSVIMNPYYIRHPELLDENGNIIDIYNSDYLSKLETVTLSPEKVEYLRSVGKIYESPFIVVADLIQLGATQSYSKIIKASHVKNAPVSIELLQQIDYFSKLIDKLPNLIRGRGGAKAEKIAEELEKFDPTDANQVYELMKQPNINMSKIMNGGEK